MSDQVAIDERIKGLVDAHRPELERLVDQALEAELARLVEQRLELRSRNGARVAELVSPMGDTPAELCSSCGQRPRIVGRAVCQTCRTARARERRAAEPEELPHPDPAGAIDV